MILATKSNFTMANESCGFIKNKLSFQPPRDEYGKDRLLDGRLYFMVCSGKSFIHTPGHSNEHGTLSP